MSSSSSKKSPKNAVDLKQIEQANEKLVILTNTLIDLADADKSTGSSYKIQKISLVDMVKEAVASFGSRFKEKTISFSAEYPASDIVTTIDRERMLFVVRTLLENSHNYTPNGGKVTVSLTHFRPQSVHIGHRYRHWYKPRGIAEDILPLLPDKERKISRYGGLRHRTLARALHHQPP